MSSSSEEVVFTTREPRTDYHPPAHSIAARTRARARAAPQAGPDPLLEEVAPDVVAPEVAADEVAPEVVAEVVSEAGEVLQDVDQVAAPVIVVDVEVAAQQEAGGAGSEVGSNSTDGGEGSVVGSNNINGANAVEDDAAESNS